MVWSYEDSVAGGGDLFYLNTSECNKNAPKVLCSDFCRR